MLNQSSLQKQVYIFMGSVDMRKSFDAFYGLVKTFHSNPLCGDLFLFVSKDRKKAKVLFWSGNGLVIWMKRLEHGRFADVLARGKMSMSELSLFFDGSKSVSQKLSPDDQTHKFAA